MLNMQLDCLKERSQMDAAQVVKDAFVSNPDMRIVLEIATRAREVEQMSPPRNLSPLTEVTSSQYLAPPAIQS